MQWFKNTLLIFKIGGMQMALLLRYKSGLEHYKWYSAHSWRLQGFFHCLFLAVLNPKMS